MFGANQEEHNSRLTAVLERVRAAGVTLNPDKCEFHRKSVKFLGPLIDEEGIRADPEKTSAITKMPTPQCVTDLRRFMGLANQLGKFSPNLAELSQPLRELLSTKRAWVWGPNQEQAFTRLKAELTRPTVLILYNPRADTKVSADASSYGLGAVLLQRSESDWKPVAYASRSMSETEQRYAQIEKEALAVTWAYEKFTDYILGREFHIETDHKPLVPLLSTNQLDRLPPRVLRFRLRLARYTYSIQHVPGKLLYTADALSRAPAPGNEQPQQLESEVESFVEAVVTNLPATKRRLDIYRQAQTQDKTCSQVLDHCKVGWPDKSDLDAELLPYWKARASLTAHENLLLHGQCIVVPASLQDDTLRKVHEGHQGVERCRARAKASVWWPGMSNDIKQMIRLCPDCAREATHRREPLIPTPLPSYPWQVVGTDLFELLGKRYLLVVDYFSRFPEVIQMSTTTSAAIIAALKSVFSRHGIPEVLRSDNGPQYAAQEFANFAASYDFRHVTSSPYFPRSNGQAERTVQTVKRLLRQAEDPYKALLSYRATPLPWCGLSPVQLCMGRHVRTSLPLTEEQLTPQWSYLPDFKRLNKKLKKRQKRNFDQRHRVATRPDISDGTDVWITSGDHPVQGKVTETASVPRSYLVETPTGVVQRNREHLNTVPPTSEHGGDPPDSPGDSEETTRDITQQPDRITTRSQTGTVVRPPVRLA